MCYMLKIFQRSSKGVSKIKILLPLKTFRAHNGLAVALKAAQSERKVQVLKAAFS